MWPFDSVSKHRQKKQEVKKQKKKMIKDKKGIVQALELFRIEEWKEKMKKKECETMNYSEWKNEEARKIRYNREIKRKKR